MKECVVLVPGLFGFGTFGKNQRTPISYFERVAEVLARRPGLSREDIHVHEPPPTGSLASRVDGLFRHLLAIVGEESLRGERPPICIHLVGHSTGGVDARLLANDRYHWSGLDEGLRARLLANVGTVVTISAPLHGTPIAWRLRWLYQAMVDGLSIWDVLDRARRGGRRSAVAAGVLTAVGAVAPRLSTNAPLLELLANLDAGTAEEIQAFRSWILGDSTLVDELTPEAMRELNGPLAGHDHPDLRHVVTVAPPPIPALEDVGRRLVYAVAYHATASDAFVPDDWPDPQWYAKHATRVDPAPRANDGVVPATSQFLRAPSGGPAYPTETVLADHLDVIGHFEGERNTTVFDSGAGFCAADHEQLWTRVSGMLGTRVSGAVRPVVVPTTPEP